MHTIKEKPVVVDGQIVIRPIMVVALTYDHRLLDGREAVTFLGKRLCSVLWARLFGETDFWLSIRSCSRSSHQGIHRGPEEDALARSLEEKQIKRKRNALSPPTPPLR
jgi:hypothetical protein